MFGDHSLRQVHGFTDRRYDMAVTSLAARKHPVTRLRNLEMWHTSNLVRGTDLATDNLPHCVNVDQVDFSHNSNFFRPQQCELDGIDRRLAGIRYAGTIDW